MEGSKLVEKGLKMLLVGLFAAAPAGVFAQLDARSIMRAQQNGQNTDL